MLNRRRYRAQQKTTKDHLERSIATLRTNVARMEGSLEGMRLAVPLPLRTFEPERCHVYFRMFRHWFCPTPSYTNHRVHVDFLSCIMREDLEFMGAIGRRKLLEQWTVFMNTFDSFTMELLHHDVVAFAPNVVVHADTMLHLRLSRESVRVLVPGALGHEPLVQKMLGNVLELPLHLRFVFDTNCVVHELGTFANTIDALVKLLGNFDDTLAVPDIPRWSSSCPVACDTTMRGGV